MMGDGRSVCTWGGSRALVWADPLSPGPTARERRPNMISCHNHGFARGREFSPPRCAPHPTAHMKGCRCPPRPAPHAAPWAGVLAGLTCIISRLNWATRGLGSRRGAAPTPVCPPHLGAVAGSLPLGLSFQGDDAGGPVSWGGQRWGVSVPPQGALPISSQEHFGNPNKVCQPASSSIPPLH